ncbi:hypothetical protein ACU4GD_20620 [Cupriavidus basilensis]
MPVRSGDEAAAAAMVEACGQALLARGELSQLSALLAAAAARPGEAAPRPAGGQVLRPALCSRRGRAAAHSWKTWLCTMMPQTRREATRAVCCAPASALQLDDADTVLAMLPQLVGHPARRRRSRAVVARQRAVLAVPATGRVRRGPPPAGRCHDAHRRAAQFAVRALHPPPASRWRATWSAPASTFREVLREAERQAPAMSGLARLAAGLLADMLYEANDPEGACRLLEPRIAVLERVSPPTSLRALTVLSNAHWLAGWRTPAVACLDRLEAYAVRFGLDRAFWLRRWCCGCVAICSWLRRSAPTRYWGAWSHWRRSIPAVREARGSRRSPLGRIEMAVSWPQDHAAGARMIDEPDRKRRRLGRKLVGGDRRRR